jgi:hypothetical protein
MSDNISAVPKSVPALGVSFSANLGEGPKAVNMVFQTHIGGDETQEQIDARLDKLVESIERQKAIAEIPEIEASIKKHQTAYDNLVDDIERLDKQRAEEWTASNRTGAPKLSAQDKVNRENGIVNADRFKNFIKVEKENLAKALEKINGPMKEKGAVKAA